jgi:tRNA G18 (ribose-2'-O)-methylase SpoU
MQKHSMQDLQRLSVEAFKKESKTSIVLILDNLRSALNVGSAFRTADAFLVEHIALCGISATPPHREINKTAIGATKTVDWTYFEQTASAVEHYKELGYRIVAVEQAQNSIPLQDYTATAGTKIALIFGNEVKGVAQPIMNTVDSCIEIPQFGTKHSFNVSVSMGILLWSLCQKVQPHLFEQNR